MNFIRHLLFSYWWDKGHKAFLREDFVAVEKYDSKIRKYIWKDQGILTDPLFFFAIKTFYFMKESDIYENYLYCKRSDD